jgi:hypothetical protein
MATSTQQYARILAAGGSLRITSYGSTLETLLTLADAARRGGSRLEIVTWGTPLESDDLVRISMAGKGAVSFDSVSEAPSVTKSMLEA